MLLDVRTAFLLLGLLYIILPLTVFILLRKYQQASVRIWCVGGLIVGVSLVLLGVRPFLERVAPEVFTITFTNALLMTGYLTRFQSLRIDVDKPVPVLLIIGPMTIYLIIFETVRAYGTVANRVEVAYFGVAVTVFLLATGALAYEKRYAIKQIRLIWISYFSLAVGLFTRSLFLFMGWESPDPFQPSVLNSLVLILGIVTVIFSNVAYLGVMLARAEKEREASTQKNIKLLNAINKQTNVIKDLMRVQAFSVVGTYGTTVVHEVLQPLTAMRFALENLKMYVLKKSPDTTTQERIEAVDSSAARAIGVVENLRNFIVEREVQVGQVSLNKVMRDVIAITSGRSRALGVNVALKINEEISVMADEHQLQRVLFNIVNNALDSIERNPDNQPDRRVLIDAKYVQQKQFVLIKVIDSGVGLASKDQAEIFEWLSTGSSKGMGIGLALSKMLVESWRGHISAYNADPKVDGLSGAIFELKLQGA